MAPQSEGIQARSDPMSVDDIQKASSELDRRRRDPAFNHREVQVTVRLDTVCSETAGGATPCAHQATTGLDVCTGCFECGCTGIHRHLLQGLGWAY